MARSRSPYGVLGAGLFLILLLLFVYSVAEVLLLLFIAVLFSLYLGDVTGFLQARLRLPRWAALSAAVLLTLVVSTSIGLLIFPPVLEQTQELIGVLPELLTSWELGLFELAGRYPLLEQMLPRGWRPGGTSTRRWSAWGATSRGSSPTSSAGCTW